MKSAERHHYAPWKGHNESLPSLVRTLGNFGRLAISPGEAHSECTRCKRIVKMGQTGGIKFWVGGQWVTKRPPCQVKTPSDELTAKADKLEKSLVLQGVTINERFVDADGKIHLLCEADL